MENAGIMTSAICDLSNLSFGEVDLSDRLKQLALSMLSEGKTVYDLSMLNPDLPPPRLLLDRLLEAGYKPANHRYAASRGIRKLREAFCAKYSSAFKVTLDPELEVCATLGTKDALFNSLNVMCKPGDSVLLGSPTYLAHLAAVRLGGKRPVFFKASNNEAAMLSEIEEKVSSQNVKVVLLNFPNNPTGIEVKRSFYEGLFEIAVKHDLFILNDFVYGEMSFTGVPSVSLLSVDGMRECGAESYSLSKAYNVPGWRVGALVGNSSMVQTLGRLKSLRDYGIFLPVQMASSAALTSDLNLVKPTTSEYFERCRMMVNGLSKIGFGVAMPSAGASVWAEMPTNWNGKSNVNVLGQSARFCEELLMQGGVHATPGAVFGKECDRFVRFAMVISASQIKEVLERIGSFCSGK